VRKHRKTAKKVMRGGRYSKTIDFSVQDQISSIIPDIAKKPTLRDKAFTLTIKNHLLGSGYDITLTVDLDKYPGLVNCEPGEGPYGQLPFKYKQIPFMPEFEAARSWKDGRKTHHQEEQSSGREDVNIIINALVNLLFRNDDMTLPKEVNIIGGGWEWKLFRRSVDNVGKRPKFTPYVLLGDDETRMINKLVILKNTNAEIAKGKKCVVNMTLKHTDDDGGKIQLVVNNYTELTTKEKGFILKDMVWSIAQSDRTKVITKMKTSNPTDFFKSVEAKFDALVKPDTPSIFYQGAIIFVMRDSVDNNPVANNPVANNPVANKLYFTFDDPSQEIAADIAVDNTNFEKVITESLDGCKSFKNNSDEELQNAAMREMKDSTCNALIDPNTRNLSEKWKLNKYDYVKYVIDEVYKRLEQDDKTAIEKLRPILDKLRKEQEETRKKLQEERNKADTGWSEHAKDR
jgi:hypothetical protein